MNKYLIILVLVLVTISCKHANTEAPILAKPCLADSAYFKRDIQPILTAACTPCHGPYNSTGYYTFSYDAIYPVLLNGKLNGSINHLIDYIPMPLHMELDTCSVLKITQWIHQGYPNN